MVLTATASGYTLLVADDPTLITAAQRLRYRVFAGELGATLHSDVPGLDTDEFDAHCDHLVVRDDRTREVVGTYRMLPPGRLSQRYADREFDLTRLDVMRDVLVETGRSCVHPDHRNGAVINLIWAGIARYLHLHGLRWLGGCASVSLDDGGATAAAVRDLMLARHLSPPALRVKPRRPWIPAMSPVDGSGSQRGVRRAEPESSHVDGRPAIPPLLRGYLRLGAWMCGEPAYDADFDCADFFVLLSLDRVHPRYLKHFLGEDGGV